MPQAPTLESGRPSNRRLLLAIAGLLALSMAVQVVRDRGWQPYEPTTPVLWFQSGPLLKRVALGFDNLVADVYWMRAVVYYGGERLSEEKVRNFDLLNPLLTLVTTLDPQFKVAYRFGAIFLAEPFPAGPGRPDQAIALLTRGIEHDQGRWEYFHDIGFIHYWWLQDYAEAARWFTQGGEQRGAPEWLAPLGATTLIEGGDRASSRALWQRLYETAEVPYIKSNAELRLAQLDALDTIDQLNLALARFTTRAGRRPATWPELVAGERLRGIPVDGAGRPFEYDPGTGTFTVSSSSPLWPLPVDRKGKGPAAPSP